MSLPMTMIARLSPIRVNADQRSPEWHRARLGNVTGSEAKDTFLEVSTTTQYAAIRKLLDIKAVTEKIKALPEFQEYMEKDPFELLDLADMRPPESAKRELYRKTRVAERLTGLPANPEGKFATYEMKWGTVNEAAAIMEYRLKTNNVVKEAPFMLHPTLRCGASPDGEVTERSTGLAGVLEVKCLASHNHLYEIIKKQQVPEEFMVQIHMEMWISGTDFCDFIGFDPRLPGQLEVFIKRVERDDDYINNVLEPQVTRFLSEVDKEEKYFRRLSRISKEQQRLLYGN